MASNTTLSWDQSSSSLRRARTMLCAPFLSPSSTLPSTSQSFHTTIFSSLNQAFPRPAPTRETTTFRVPTTPPWMMPTDDNAVPRIAAPKTVKTSRKGQRFKRKVDRSLNDKVGGVRGKKVVDKIVDRINRLKEVEKVGEAGEGVGGVVTEVGFEVRLRGNEGEVELGRMPWVRDEGKERFLWRGIAKEESRMRRRRKKVMASGEELGIEEGLLRRLRSEAEKMRKWVKVKKIGVSEEVVEEIRGIWRTSELAMVKFDMPLCRNMDRAQEILEMKTGGLVAWRKKDTLVIYRGSENSLGKFKACNVSEVCPNLNSDSGLSRDVTHLEVAIDTVHVQENSEAAEKKVDAVLLGERGNFEPITRSLYEREADRLLDGLGPRFVDWWMRKPLPVDADLLPDRVPGFSPPMRLTLPKERSQLTNFELTFLRKLAHTLPVHFVLGKNRNLQGLAAAILKLWEKSIIAKIAVKWGVPNTNSEQMACELKRLTGGILLLRNKFYIILFRGKDFLPPSLATSVVKREREQRISQVFEENARVAAYEKLSLADELLAENSFSGTLSEFLEMGTQFVEQRRESVKVYLKGECEIEKLKKELGKQERRLYILKSKISKSATQISKLNCGWRSAEQDADREMMTKEEGECLRKIGLKMDDSLVLGRRGVYNGVIEAIHQHWKHREVVKVITKQRTYQEVLITAQLLELESQGIIVSIDNKKEGHAIILYRGKNYKRPGKLVTEHLLSKRKALLRSLEMQRLGSLKFFACQAEMAISDLKVKKEELEMKQFQT